MKYVANPVEVDAFKIVSVSPVATISPSGENVMSLSVETDEPTLRLATPEMTSRYIPKPGDYWVIQPDGYEYVNPAEVFERKYSPVVNLGAEVRRAGLQGA